MTGTQEELPGSVEIRTASPADCAAIKSFIAGLSLRARFLRFFTPASPPTPAVLRGLCGGGRTTDVLVATVGGAVIGHAMAADAVAPDGGRVTDIGLVVADRWQHRGVGSDLLGRVVTRAAARGVSALEMDVLPENRPMLAIISRRWADAKYEYGGGSVFVRVPLAGGAPAPQGGGHATAVRAA